MRTCLFVAVCWLLLVVSSMGQPQRGDKLSPSSQTRPSVTITKIEPLPLVLPKATTVRLRMPYPVSISATAVGQRFTWEAAEDVGVEGAVFIARGAKANATVTTTVDGGNRRRLSMIIDSVRLTNGDTAQLLTERTGNRTWNFFTTRSDDAVIPEGTEITVFLANDVSMRPVQAGGDPVKTESVTKELPVLLPAATSVFLKFAHPVTSEYAQKGDRVSFQVTEPVVIDSLTVVPKGSIAWGTVTEAQTSRNHGRPGKLSIAFDYVQVANGKKAFLTAGSDAQASDGPADSWEPGAVYVAGGALRAAVESGFDAMIPQGTEVTAYIKGDVTLDPSELHAVYLPVDSGPSKAN